MLSVSGDFPDGVQFEMFDSFLRKQLQIAGEGAWIYDSVQFIRKSYAMLAHSRNWSEASKTLLAVAVEFGLLSIQSYLFP